MLGVPADPARGAQHEFVLQVFLAESRSTDDIDAADLRDFAFLDRETDADPVALERGHRGLHVHSVKALGQVLPFQLLLGLLEERTVEDPGLREPEFPETAPQGFRLEFLDPREIDLRDRGTLLHEDDEHSILDFEAHISKEPGRKQRADGLLRLLIGHLLADFDRKIAEDSAGFGALQPFDANVFDGERLESACSPTETETEQTGYNRGVKPVACHSAG